MRNVVFLIMALVVLSGCGAKEADISEETHTENAEQAVVVADDSQENEEDEYGEEETVESEDGEQQGGFLPDHWNYFGYEDEWNGESVQDFTNQDYDNDGITDRVYREQGVDMGFCHYRIEMGNGIVIDMDKDVYGTGFPHVKGADINGDGENEIIFSLTYDTSTDMRSFGDMEIYEKHGNSYEKAKLPFEESEEGCEQTIPVRYEAVHEMNENLIKVSVDGYETLVPINTYQWDNLSYSGYDCEMNCTVWDNYIFDHNGEEKLVCKIRLFDKWSWYGLFAVLGYENGEYKVDEWWRVNDEFGDITGDSPWELYSYRLCRKELETENGIYIVELWLDKGIYGNIEEFGAGGGIYEENYIGQYYLAVTNENGEVLSKRELEQDFEDGGKMNFPGSFEIVVADYNQDGCPDFTIGSYLSSTANLYALYTVWDDGKIGLLGKDIPNSSPSDFSIAFETRADKSFCGSIYDNTVGEDRTVVYVWEDTQKKYVESE